MSTAVEKPKDPSKLRPVVRAAVNPVNLGIGAGAAVLAIGLGSLPLALLGGLAYSAMVAYDALTPDKRATRAIPATLPDPETIRDLDTRKAIEAISASKSALAQTIDETPADVIAHMSTTLATIQQLDAHAARLVVRSEDIGRYFANVDLRALVEEVKALEQRAKDASHPDSRKTLEDALMARKDQLRSLKELAATRELISAQLSRLVAVYGALPTKLVHMRALDAAAMDKLSGDMNEELQAVGEELQTSEKVIKNLEVE